MKFSVEIPDYLPTNDAMAAYMRALYNREQAEEAGIGSIYNCAW